MTLVEVVSHIDGHKSAWEGLSILSVWVEASSNRLKRFKETLLQWDEMHS